MAGRWRYWLNYGYSWVVVDGRVYSNDLLMTLKKAIMY